MRTPWNNLWKFVVSMMVLMSLSLAEIAQAIEVNSKADTEGGGAVMTLRRAIKQANSQGYAVISFKSKDAIVLKSDLPPIQSSMTIEGYPNNITISGDGKYRVFTVLGGDVILENLTITKAYAKGGDGGNGSVTTGGGGAGMGAALFINGGRVDCRYVNFTNNTAEGGEGGKITSSIEYAGSGGGFAGNGTSLIENDGSNRAKGGSGGALEPEGLGGDAGENLGDGGNGGFGGGGGAAGNNLVSFQTNGGAGGFGGGGGGALPLGAPGAGGLFGGNAYGNNGGGGAGLGGAIFVRDTVTSVSLDHCTFTGNKALHGAGPHAGYFGLAKGGALFIMDGRYVTVYAVSFSNNTAADAEYPDYSFSLRDLTLTVDQSDIYGNVRTYQIWGFPSEISDWSLYR